MTDGQELETELFEKLKVLNERLWEDRVRRPIIEAWLANFADDDVLEFPSERLHTLYLLSQFIYFGDREVRELLRSLYRDHFRYPVMEALRRDNSDTNDVEALTALYEAELAETRFLGVGSPAESGTHLLYYFRQENRLPNNVFVSLADLVNLAEIYADDTPSPFDDTASVRRIVFVDDLCGSGMQATRYARRVLPVLRDMAKRRGTEVVIEYLVLVADQEALTAVRDKGAFDRVAAVLELDGSHKSLEPESRHFRNVPDKLVSRTVAREIAVKYGRQLQADNPLGWRDGQLLLGFHHNIPNNTLPIIWYDEPPPTWTAVFPRYPKIEK
jgi:hypothetical protein